MLAVLQKRANGLRYLRVGGRGFALGAGKLEARKMLENAARPRRRQSHTSGARFVGPQLRKCVPHTSVCLFAIIQTQSKCLQIACLMG
jgi:hypothetical protein